MQKTTRILTVSNSNITRVKCRKYLLFYSTKINFGIRISVLEITYWLHAQIQHKTTFKSLYHIIYCIIKLHLHFLPSSSFFLSYFDENRLQQTKIAFFYVSYKFENTITLKGELLSKINFVLGLMILPVSHA